MATKEKTRKKGGRPTWSGIITFGLVSVPVHLYPARRASRVSMRLLDRDGTPIQRRYYCPRHHRDVHPEHLARGFEIGPDEYVIVHDDELERLEPRKSRDIDLRRFVDRSEISPIYLERVHYLVPRESTKAYRLLAQVMEEAGLAGLGTFIMHDREYLVAILAENGILRAETLRFQHEIRDPDSVGLPEPETPNRRTISTMARAIDKQTASKVDPADLKDEYAEALLERAREKRLRGEDVYEISEPEKANGVEGGNGVDLLDTIRRSLGLARSSASGNGRRRSTARKRPSTNGRHRRTRSKGRSKTRATAARR